MGSVKAIILIGGKSTRMGTEKHLLEVHGQPQYKYLFNLVSELGIDTYLSCNQEQAQKLKVDMPLLIDHYSSIGPIGGLVTAIEEDPETAWLVIACDLIYIQTETIKDLINYKTDRGIVTYQRSGTDFYETTLTLYYPDVFPTVTQLVKSQKYSLQGVLKASTVHTLEPHNSKELTNVNRPQDLL